MPNRTATDWFQDFAKLANGLLFLRGKIQFLRPDGSIATSPGYGNVFMAFGNEMAIALKQSKLDGIRV